MHISIKLIRATTVAVISSMIFLSATTFANISCNVPKNTFNCKSHSGENLQGIFQINNNSYNKLAPSQLPLGVKDHQTLNIAVCNAYNKSIKNEHWQKTNNTLIPTLVNYVGKNARVGLLINNSANIQLDQRLILGEHTINDQGIITEQQGDEEPALITNLILGKILEKAQIKVTIKDSANVEYLNSYSNLHIGGGSLIEEIVNATEEVKSQSNYALHNACVKVDIRNSANINNNHPMNYYGILNIGSGQILNEVIDYPIQNSHASILIEDSANTHVNTAKIFKGELIDEVIDTTVVNGSDFNISIKNSANIKAKSLAINDAELIDESIDAQDINNSTLVTIFDKTANVEADTLSITEGEIIDEAFDVESVKNSQLEVRFIDSANILAKNFSIFEGELIDESIDGERYEDSRIQVHFKKSANVTAPEGSISIKQGELIDEVIDAESINKSTLQLSMYGSANTRSKSVTINEGELIDEMIDIENFFNNTSFHVYMKSSANVITDTFDLYEGELTDEIVDAQSGTVGTFAIDVLQSANVRPLTYNFNQGLAMLKQGELMDEILDISDLLTDISGHISLSASANIRQQHLSLNHSQLIDEVADIHKTQRLSLSVKLNNVANAYAKDAKISLPSRLIDAVIETSENEDSVQLPIKIGLETKSVTVNNNNDSSQLLYSMSNSGNLQLE